MLFVAVCCVVNEAGDAFISHQQHEAGDAFISHQQRMDVSPTSPDVEDNLKMVIGSQSFRDEVQTVIAQQMKVEPVPAANAFLPYAARGCYRSRIHTSTESVNQLTTSVT